METAADPQPHIRWSSGYPAEERDKRLEESEGSRTPQEYSQNQLNLTSYGLTESEPKHQGTCMELT